MCRAVFSGIQAWISHRSVAGAPGWGGRGMSLVNGGSAVAAIAATRYSPFDTLTRHPKQYHVRR
jgi:hypothetical protein